MSIENENCGLVVNVQADSQAEPDGENLHILLFQSARELLFNVVKHGQTGRARVEMAAAPHGKVRLELPDDGAGFDLASLNADRSAGGGFRPSFTLLAAISED